MDQGVAGLPRYRVLREWLRDRIRGLTAELGEPPLH